MLNGAGVHVYQESGPDLREANIHCLLYQN